MTSQTGLDAGPTLQRRITARLNGREVTSSVDTRLTLADWLRDEVDIDFPSVSSVLDRMRHSFFGAAHATELCAEVELTPEEAFWGTSVPLEIPLRRTCRACGGRGEVWEQWCADCQGDGDVALQHPLRLRVPAGVRPGARFRFSIMPPGAVPTLVEVRISVR